MAAAAQGTTYAKGNPRLTCPGKENDKKRRRQQRLIVLCDGTGQDSYGSDAQNPTNITRLARALSPNAWVLAEGTEDKYDEVEQTVFYQPGIGTSEGNEFWGLIFGTGLSEIVRAAYGFLANNWEEGDSIYIFGFSRGAYIARSIAGLVAERGLLNKRGMDNFHSVYETFYNQDEKTEEQAKIPTKGSSMTPEAAGLQKLPPGTVKVVGVFDTVGFHNPITANLSHWWKEKFSGGDRDEFQNTTLSLNVKFAFHALSLDESRTPFQTTLFFKEKNPATKPNFDTVLKQVWFSGAHSDVGGGMQDPRLSKIALGWMISELETEGLLSFDRNYLIDSDFDEFEPREEKWATTQGPNKDVFPYNEWFSYRRLKHELGRIVWGCLHISKHVAVFIVGLFSSKAARTLSGVRTPGQYVPVINFAKNKEKKDEYSTNEEFHDSIRDRHLKKLPSPSAEGHGVWPSAAMKDLVKEGDHWTKNGDPEVKPIIQPHAGFLEENLRTRLRFKKQLDPTLAESAVSVHEQAMPVWPEGRRNRD